MLSNILPDLTSVLLASILSLFTMLSYTGVSFLQALRQPWLVSVSGSFHMLFFPSGMPFPLPLT